MVAVVLRDKSVCLPQCTQGAGGTGLFAQCKDGSRVNLSEVLTENRWAVPEELTGLWEAVTVFGQPGSAARHPDLLTLHRDGWFEYESGPYSLNQSILTLLGETRDGLVYRYWLSPDEDMVGVDPPYSGTMAFRVGYDRESGQTVLYATTLSVDEAGILQETPGAVTELYRAWQG